MSADRVTHTYFDDVDERRVVETWKADGTPEIAAADPALPAGYAPQSVWPECKVISRQIDFWKDEFTPISRATITYSNRQDKIQEPDGDAVLCNELMGKLKRQYWDLDTSTWPSPTERRGIGPNCEGWDVYIPVEEIVYEHYETVFQEREIGDLVGKVNAGEWKAAFEGPEKMRPAGTLLFLGARARQQCPGKVRVTYHFDYHPNGHRAAWCETQEVTVPIGAGHYLHKLYVEPEQTAKVYEEGDFSTLPF